MNFNTEHLLQEALVQVHAPTTDAKPFETGTPVVVTGFDRNPYVGTIESSKPAMDKGFFYKIRLVKPCAGKNVIVAHSSRVERAKV